MYPVYFLGKDSMAAGDVSTLGFFSIAQPSVGNELMQFKTVGFKGIVGATAITFDGNADGAGSDAAEVSRVYKFTVIDGRSGQLP